MHRTEHRPQWVRRVVSVLSGAGDRPSNGVESMENDDSVGGHEKNPRSTEGRPAFIGEGPAGAFKRPYAVANLSHGTVTFRCAIHSREAVLLATICSDDVMWWSTRINKDESHLHHEDGTCIPRVIRVAAIGSARIRNTPLDHTSTSKPSLSR